MSEIFLTESVDFSDIYYEATMVDEYLKDKSLSTIKNGPAGDSVKEIKNTVKKLLIWTIALIAVVTAIRSYLKKSKKSKDNNENRTSNLSKADKIVLDAYLDDKAAEAACDKLMGELEKAVAFYRSLLKEIVEVESTLRGIEREKQEIYKNVKKGDGLKGKDKAAYMAGARQRLSELNENHKKITAELNKKRVEAESTNKKIRKSAATLTGYHADDKTKRKLEALLSNIDSNN